MVEDRMKSCSHVFSSKTKEMFGLLHYKARSTMVMVQSSTRGVIVVFFALFLLVVLISVRLINNEVRPFNPLMDVMFCS